MEKEFVTYEIAAKLKELGFDEKCMGMFGPNKEFFIDESSWRYGKISNEVLIRPLWQQAIDWLREKHNLHLSIMIEDAYAVADKTWNFRIHNIDWGGDREVYCLASSNIYKTFEDARESAILKTIELCQK